MKHYKKTFAIVGVCLVFLLAYITLIPSKKPQPKIAPKTQPKEITITGTVVCLPHKNKGGAHTMECAYGLRDGEGKYYGLRNTDPEVILSTPTGETLTVHGTLFPDPNTNYDIVGVIETSQQ